MTLVERTDTIRTNATEKFHKSNIDAYNKWYYVMVASFTGYHLRNRFGVKSFFDPQCRGDSCSCMPVANQEITAVDQVSQVAPTKNSSKMRMSGLFSEDG